MNGYFARRHRVASLCIESAQSSFLNSVVLCILHDELNKYLGRFRFNHHHVKKTSPDFYFEPNLGTRQICSETFWVVSRKSSFEIISYGMA